MNLHRGCVAGLMAVAATLVAAPAAPAATLPAGFEQRTELSGLTRPTKVAWAPDGRRFVAEKDGIVRVALQPGTASEVLLDLRGTVNSFHDRGLLGLAVDSDFANHPYIYLSYTYDVRAASDPDSGDPMVSRVERVRIGAGKQVLERRTILGSYVSGPCPPPSNNLDCIPADGHSHSIGTVISAPDGTLFVGNGDAAGFFALDRLSLRTYDDTSMAGKILRVDRDGKGLASHPACPAETNLSRVCTKVWAKGFRNPFRFTRRPNGFLMVGDVGWNNEEEVDAVREGGRSFGWPCYEGTIRTPGWKDDAACAPEYAKEGTAAAHRPPIHAYTHGGTSAAVQAGPEYTGGPYPSGFDGNVFYGDYAKGFIRRMHLDTVGSYAGSTAFATDWQGVDLSSAPNGDLTWADPGDWGPGGGSIQRAVYTANRAPTAVIAADPSSGPAPLRVRFDGSGSTDPDGDTLTYSWSFGDGTAGSTAQSPQHVYAEDGSYTATLTVSDGEAGDSATVRIDADNTPPVARIDSPADGAPYRGGVPLTVRGSASDAQDASVTDLDWNVLLIHDDHVHPYASGSGAEFTFTPAQDHDADSHYEVELTARDEDGASASASIVVNPETVPLHLRSEPPGALLSYDGTPLTAPHDRQAAIGFKAGVSAEPSFQVGGRTWVFDRWSDGGEAAHTLTVPDTETTLTAVYRDSSGPIMGPLPGPPLTSPVKRDLTGPRIGFHARRGLALKRHLLRGVADDRAGVKAVSVAMARVQRGGCRWLVPSPRRLARHAASCARPRWIAATVQGRRWSLRLSKTMAAGRYRLRFKATDQLDNLSGRLRNGRASVPVRLP
jgi:glucose/arabinose dehydrogenase